MSRIHQINIRHVEAILPLEHCDHVVITIKYASLITTTQHVIVPVLTELADGQERALYVRHLEHG